MNRHVLLLFLFFFGLLGAAVAAEAADVAAQSLLSAGRVDVAISGLRTHLRSSPDDAQAYNLLCRAYYSVQQWNDAISGCERAVQLEPAISEYHLWLGRAYGKKAEHSSWLSAIGLAKKVRKEFERAVQLDGRNVSARSDLAEFYADAPGFLGGGKDKARAEAEQIAALDPAAAHEMKAVLAEKDSDVAAAEAERRAAVTASSNDGTYWVNLASFYRRHERYNEMADAIRHATSAPVRKGETYVDAASILYRSGRDLPTAAQLLRTYLASDTKSEDAPAFEAHFLLGNILEKQGDVRGAANEYRAALSLAQEFDSAREALDRLE
jgi:cytochrome c-type biogenesis protein CcmH/NrfG